MILRQGRVIDPESGFDQICDVVLKDGTIAFVGELSQYTGDQAQLETIDCKGLAVVPGFIDTHAHGQDEESSRLQACDGVTTHLEMEFGAFPVSKFYESREGKAVINYGCTVGHIPARIAALSPDIEAPKVAQCCLTPHLLSTCICTASETHGKPCNCGPSLAELRVRIEQGLDEGGLGIGMGIAYVEAANHEEIYRLFKIGATYKVPCFVHNRGHMTDMSDWHELFADATASGCALQLCHVHSSCGKNVNFELLMEMVEDLNAQGIDVTCEAYPYTAGTRPPSPLRLTIATSYIYTPSCTYQHRPPYLPALPPKA
jgi:hypothetical protein